MWTWINTAFDLTQFKAVRKGGFFYAWGEGD